MEEPIEQWRYIRKCLAQTPTPKQRELAKDLGISRSRVSNLARLCDLPPAVIQWIDAGDVPIKVAEQLCKKGVSSALQASLAMKACNERWSAGRAAKEVAKAIGLREKDAFSTDADIAMAERELGEILNTKVRFNHNADGSGWMRIYYASTETLEGVTERLKQTPRRER